jgi:sulfate adenylyltransferase subunit 2
VRALDTLQAEAIHILRAVVGERDRPVMLFSGGKDSLLMLHLARKAFWPGPIPFPLLHVDTGHNFPELIAFRDQVVAELGLQLIVAEVEPWLRDGRLAPPPDGSRNQLQIPVLLDALRRHGFDAAFGGARRDEERARAKERVMSHRDRFGVWEPRAQRPEPWDLWNTQLWAGEHLRVFPLSNFSELDVWTALGHERVELPGLYFSHTREVVERDGLLLAVNHLNPLLPGEVSAAREVRFRTLGDAPSTGAMASTARTIAEVIRENLLAPASERGTGRGDDRASAAAMEDRKRAGYF